ncbi:PD-(D/E)XK nuclease family protein [Nocardiopsis tropica]|nr:PD-(D/E)XK nuclease family protein [Nocardiopsis tropica]
MPRSAAISSTGQREFHSGAAEQRLSLEFLHEYVHGTHPDLYALALALHVNDHNAAALVDPQWTALREKKPEVDELFADEAERDTWLESARDLVRRYFDLENPTALEPRDREMRLDVALPTGLKLRGYVDRLDVTPTGQIRIVDYKTGKSPHPRFEDKARFQIFFYAVMIWRDLGVVPTRLQLVYLGGDGAVRWYDPTEDELRAAEEEISGIWARIEEAGRTGVWAPRKSKLCGWCEHQALCPEFGGTPPPLPTA